MLAHSPGRSHTIPLLLLLVGVCAISGLTAAGAADNWPQFRGTTGGVIADDPALPEHWSQTENIAWKADIPGLGWGSPVVWGDYVFVSTAVSDKDEIRGVTPGIYADRTEKQERAIGTGKDPDFTVERRWMLYAFDVNTGKLRWETELRRGLPREKKYLDNTYASETPVTDGERVYVFHASAGLFAVDFTGRIVWSRAVDLPDTPPVVNTVRSDTLKRRGDDNELPPAELSDIGAGSSPALHDGRLFLTMDHEPRQWLLLAFDAKTGEELWRVHKGKTQEAFGWSTPYIWQNPLRTELITAGDLEVRSYDPATGHLLWQFGRLSVNTTPTPYAANGMLYISSGYPGDRTRPIAAIHPGASGDISLKAGEDYNDHVAWYQERVSSYMNSTLVYGNYHYTLLTQGFLVCHDARTGEPVYTRQRIDVNSTGFTASPWAYNGKIFAISEEGDTYAIQPGPEFKLLWKNSLDEMVMATPAIARGSLFVRTASHLYRIAKTK
jgi:outer membrane protein assembly factor BamB